MSRLLFALPLLCVASLLTAETHAAPPNVVIVIADDCTYKDLEVYGGQAKTPHMAKLASEGMTFSRCFQAAPMCSPTRHALYTGIYPVKSGAYPNHTNAYAWVRSIAGYLNDAGYRTHLSGKTHIGPRTVFPFDYSSKGNNPDPAVIDKFFSASKSDGKPFLLVAASNEPHEPWNKGDASQYPPASLTLPPVLVDTPETREAFPKYLAEITYFDGQVGEIMGLLKTHDLEQNTLVIVLSEQGNSFPFAKWTCYEVGLASGCVVRFPGVVKAGTKSDALVEYIDVVPTILELASVEIPEVIDGRSFLPVLKGEAETHKEYVFGLQTSRGINNGPEQYGIRSVRDKRYRYVLNLTPEVGFKNAATQGAVWDSWTQKATEGDRTAIHLVSGYRKRPAEELYDSEADPWNRTNLIDDPELKPVRDRLRAELDRWMTEQGDKGAETEMNALERMSRHNKAGRKKKGGRKAARK